MNKRQFLESLNEVYCKLGVSKHGVGVFAIRAIPKGVDPFVNCDKHGDVLTITKVELDAAPAPKAAKDLVRDFCALQDGKYHVPDYGIDAIDKSYFLNHSPASNMVTHDGGETFVAARRIKAGEELTANYDSYHHTKHFMRK